MQTSLAVVIALITVTLVIGASVKQPRFAAGAKQNATIVSLTFEPSLQNNSILHIDPNSGKFTRSFPFPIFQYEGACVDTNRRKYLLVAQNQIAQLNADTFLIEDHYSIPETPTEISFDAQLNATYGIIIGRDHQYVGLVDWFKGAVTPLVYFDDYMGVILGASAYDPVKHLYYVASSDQDGKNLYLRIDVLKKTMTPINTNGNLLDNCEVDTNRDRLIGYLNSTLYSIDALSGPSPKLTPLIKFPGLPLLYANTIDVANDRYFIGMLYFWEETKTFLAIDLKKNSVIYNTTVYMAPFMTGYLPGN